MKRPTPLMLLGLGAAVSMVAHGVALTAAPSNSQGQTRMGASIQESIAERDRKAAQRARSLDIQEQALRAAEQRIATSPQQAPAATPAAPASAPGAPVGATGNGQMANDPAEQQFENLARIYQTMKPARAAVVFEKLSLDVQVKIARKMRERSMALIMGAMEPEKAAKLSMALAGRRPPEATGAARQAAVPARQTAAAKAAPKAPSK